MRLERFLYGPLAPEDPRGVGNMHDTLVRLWSLLQDPPLPMSARCP